MVGGTWWLGRGHLAGSPSSTLGAAVGAEAEVGTDVGAEVGAGVGNRMGLWGCSRNKWEKEAVSAFCDQENKTKGTCSSGLPRVDFFHLNALEAVL